MAKPKGTGIPSYDRINMALAATSEFKEYEESFKRFVKSVRVDGLSCEKLALSSSLDGYPDYVFEVAVDGKRCEKLAFRDMESVSIRVSHIVTPESLSPVLATFGTKVSTFFCKREAVALKFLEFAQDRLEKQFPNLLEEARLRLVAQAQAMIDSGRVQKERVTAYENEAIEEIRSVLIKYRSIRPEARKRALDEFHVADVHLS